MSQIQFINTLDIVWNIGQSGSSCSTPLACVAIGTSSNPVYVTLAPNVLPPVFAGTPNPIMLTYVALAVGNGGAVSQAAALANTWAKFSTTSCATGAASCPANVLTWDGRTMSYYTAGFGSCALTARELVRNLDNAGNMTSSGQCGAFALLLESALAMNGIHSNWIQVNSAYADPGFGRPMMLINNWCFIGTTGCPAGSPYYDGENVWKYRLKLNLGDWMFPPRTPASFGDLTNLTGLAGQGENAVSLPPFTPAEKVFGFHFIVQIPAVDGGATPGNQFFDPSSGVTYPSAPGFEAQAVAGYMLQFAPDDSANGEYHVLAPIAGSPNIAFAVNLSRSM